jgi:sugar O-acyltransferase (sialic acid O-acetyltransferase NeuD family)
MKNIALIGYSGHAYVTCEIFFSQQQRVSAYTDTEEKEKNPYALKWLGNENKSSVIKKLKEYVYFVSIGNNLIRRKISTKLIKELGLPINAIHSSAIISKSMHAGLGNMFAARAVINPLVKIGTGVICNTGCIIEHECMIDDYVHIAPGAVLCGNVSIGEGSFIGANAVIKEGIKIGKHVTVGAGAVILKNIPDNKKVVGNPQRII